MRDGVHDNRVSGQAVDPEQCRLVLHTVWPHAEPPEVTDIAFDGVVVHHVEQQKAGGGPFPATVLFEVEEADPALLLWEYTELLARTKYFGWPVSRYEGLSDLVTQLTVDRARCFEVQGVCGVHGFVFARSMELRPRTSRAEVAP